jgi:DNA-binding transcriptional LysR family regulator
MVLADMYLTTWIAEFVKRHPQVQVELSVNNAMVDLISERVDVAIRMSHTLLSSSLVARRLATVAKYACASPAYLAAHGTPRTPEELRNHACLRFSPLRVEAEWKFESGRSSVVIPASGPFSSDSAEALRSAALADMGIIVLPTFFLMDDLAQGRLVRVLENYRVPSLGVFAVYAKGKVVPAKVRKFVDLLAARMRPAPWDRRPTA